MNTYTPDTITEAYSLAALADTYTPESLDSAGANWLRYVRDALAEAVTYDDFDPEDLHELADSAVLIYTAERWAVFADLGLYNEDPSELGYDLTDLTGAGPDDSVGIVGHEGVVSDILTVCLSSLCNFL